MPSLEIIALDAATPRLRAPAAGDTYIAPCDILMGSDIVGLGRAGNATSSLGIRFNGANGLISLYGSGAELLRTDPAVGVTTLNRFCMGSALYAPDCGLERVASGIMKLTNGTLGALATLRFPVYTVSTLPTAAGAGAGAKATVSDSSVAMAANYGAIVAGAGANIVPVFCDGVNWRIG